MPPLVLALLAPVLALLSLCSSSPLPPAADAPRTLVADCGASSLIQETLNDIQKLKGITEMTPLNDMAEQEDNVFTHLERFIQVLETSKPSMEKIIVQKLRRIHAARNSCVRWTELVWEPMEGEDFLENLEYLVKFLNHNAYLEKTA